MTRLGTLALGTLAAVLLTAGSAAAQQVVVDDPAGDAGDNAIDFTRVSIDNGDRLVVARLRLENAEPGNVLIISVDPRGARGVRLISEYDPVGHTTNYVVDGAFGEKRPGRQPLDCRGFRVNWSAQHPVVTLKLPSRCLNDGDYGAVRFAALTEGGESGGDADDMRKTDWVPRG